MAGHPPFTTGPWVKHTILILLHFALRLWSKCVSLCPQSCLRNGQQSTKTSNWSKYWEWNTECATLMNAFTKPTKVQEALRKKGQKECAWQNAQGVLWNAVICAWVSVILVNSQQLHAKPIQDQANQNLYINGKKTQSLLKTYWVLMFAEGGDSSLRKWLLVYVQCYSGWLHTHPNVDRKNWT